MMLNDIDENRIKLTRISKYMSMLLRHHPEAIGLDMDEHGWVKVNDLIEGIQENKSKTFGMNELEEIVRTDEKQRYSFNADKTLIRANQGHSIQVDVELKKRTPPEILYHGTGEKYVASIDQQGLLSKARLYVHLSWDIETAIKVGKRHGKVVIYKVDAKKMAKDGYDFYLSVNNVWLTHDVPVLYLSKVELNK